MSDTSNDSPFSRIELLPQELLKFDLHDRDQVSAQAKEAVVFEKAVATGGERDAVVALGAGIDPDETKVAL